MVAQYAVAGTTSGLVVGTDHAAEAVMGFFTKYVDCGFDLTPLGGLTKRRVRSIAAALGADSSLAGKVAADLETLRPLRPDEAALGVSYERIDDFLEGRPVPAAAAQTIIEIYRQTAHKRALPAAPALDSSRASVHLRQAVEDPALTGPPIAVARTAQFQQLHFQFPQFPHLRTNLFDVRVNEVVHLLASELRAVPEGQQLPDLGQVHVLGTAPADEEQPIQMTVVVQPKVAFAPGGRGQQPLGFVEAHGLDETLSPPREFSYAEHIQSPRTLTL